MRKRGKKDKEEVREFIHGHSLPQHVSKSSQIPSVINTLGMLGLCTLLVKRQQGVWNYFRQGRKYT